MKTYLILFGAFLLSISSCKKETGGSGNQASEDRQKALDDYNNNYLGSALTFSLWSGNINDCEPGLCPQATNDKVIQRINYFRRMVGLNDNTTLDASLFPRFQKTALMMKANNQIDHFPPNTWDCWTQDGAYGAETSNLSIGSHSVNAITGQIRDDGANNAAVGHRRWILHSLKTKFSYGSTDNTMSLGVMGIPNGDANTKYPEFIPYPPNGYIPLPLVFQRWSCSVPTANMSAATVTMTGPSGNVPLTIISQQVGVSMDNAVVWVPTGIDLSGNSDVEYTVTVSNIINGPKTSYTYTVKIFKP